MPRVFRVLASDWVLAAALFAIAAAVGFAYVRAFDRTGVRAAFDLRSLPSRSMWYAQSDFGPAVALACGRGYVDPPADVPDLERFLSAQTDRFACANLPTPLAQRPLRLAQRLYPYLLSATAAVWAIRGVSWSALWPLFGLLYGATVALGFGLFRLGMGRKTAAAMAVALMVSPVHLGNLPGLRDYAKAPFILALILIAANIVRRLNQERSILVWSASFGATLGIGFGFRNDLLIVVPLIALALFGWDPPRNARAVGVRIAAVGVAAVTFAIVAFPVLSGYRQGSNSGHVALLGLMSPFDRPLGIVPSVYEWGRVYSDRYADAVVESYSNRVHGREVVYFSAEYDRAAVEYLVQVARRWPADVIARAYASVLRIADMPFTPGTHAEPIPYGIDGDLPSWFYGWHNAALGLLGGKGIALVAVTLVALSSASVWRAVLLFAALLYFTGYPAIQFQPRHFFHLEFIAWWALGFVVYRAAAAYRAGQRGVRLWPVARSAAVRMAAFAVIVVASLALPLVAARNYQQRFMKDFLRRYAEAPRVPLPVEQVAAGERTLLRTFTLWKHRDPSLSVNAQYVVARFSPAACPLVRLPVTFRYAVLGDEQDFSFETVLTFLPSVPVDVFVPAYDVPARSHFDGIEVSTGLEGCVERVTRVRDLDPLPMLLHLTLTPEWDRRPLYQRFADWEVSAPTPSLHALPEAATWSVRTVYSRPTPPPLLWQASILHPDGSGGWRVAGTPPSPVWPLFEFAAESHAPDDQFVVEGEVLRGGVTVGLVRDHRWTAAGHITIATPGPFIAVLATPAAGEYGVLAENGLNDSWFLRNAPAALVRLVGRAHDFNDVRITRAGWIRQE